MTIVLLTSGMAGLGSPDDAGSTLINRPGRVVKYEKEGSWRDDAVRRGLQRAIIGPGHTMLVIACTMLKANRRYHDPGGYYLDQINKDPLKRNFLKRLQRLGLKATIELETTLARNPFSKEKDEDDSVL